MTLKELLTNLRHIPKNLPIVIENKEIYFNGQFGSDFTSPEKMYLGYNFNKMNFTVKQMIELLKKAKNKKIMYGCLGGEFEINNDTQIVISNYADDISYNILKIRQDTNCAMIIATMNNKGR